MVHQIKLPEDLHEDMEVLFVYPYSPEASEMLQMGYATERELTRVFEEAVARDPGFEKFSNKIEDIIIDLDLNAYVASDDLVILYGDEDKLLEAQSLLESEYTCAFDKVATLLEHAAMADEAPAPNKPTLH